MGGKIIVVVEAAIQSGRQGFAIQDDGANESCRVITLLLEQLRQGRVSTGQRNREIGNAVRARQQSGQDRGVRSIGDRTGRERFRKANAFFCQRIQSGSSELLVTITMNMVGAEGVYSDEEYISMRWFPRGYLGYATKGHNHTKS